MFLIKIVYIFNNYGVFHTSILLLLLLLLIGSQRLQYLITACVRDIY